MSKDLNQCNFIGRLGKPIEMTYAQSGAAVAKFSIACGDDYKDKSGAKVEQTNWVSMVAFGKSAEILEQYTEKGSMLFVSGKLTVRKWQDQNNQDRWSTEINVQNFQFLSSGSKTGQQQQAQPQQAQPQQQPQQQDDNDFDDIPF